MFCPGVFEWVIICFIALLLFGKRLPEVAKNISETIATFKRGLDED